MIRTILILLDVIPFFSIIFFSILFPERFSESRFAQISRNGRQNDSVLIAYFSFLITTILIRYWKKLKEIDHIIDYNADLFLRYFNIVKYDDFAIMRIRGIYKEKYHEIYPIDLDIAGQYFKSGDYSTFIIVKCSSKNDEWYSLHSLHDYETFIISNNLKDLKKIVKKIEKELR